jgi:hypothetical protein
MNALLRSSLASLLVLLLSGCGREVPPPRSRTEPSQPPAPAAKTPVRPAEPPRVATARTEQPAAEPGDTAGASAAAPSLSELLAAEDPAVARNGLLAGLQAGRWSERDLVALLKTLPSASAGVVAETLGRHASPESVRLLFDLGLGGATAAERRLALRGIARLSATQAWDRMVGALTTPGTDPSIALACQGALAAAASPENLHALVSPYFANSDPAVRTRFEAVLRSVRSPALVPSLGQLAGPAGMAPSSDMAVAALQTLAVIGTQEAVGLLIERATTTPPEKSEEVLHALSMVRSPESRALLEGVASNQSGVRPDEVRAAAIQALGEWYDEGPQSFLLALAANEPPGTVADALRIALGADEEPDS